MAQVTVQQSGGDYGSLNAATGAAETDILISGTWTSADTTAITMGTASAVVASDSSSKHGGRIEASPSYYRLEVSSGDAIDINAAGCSIDGIVVKCASTGVSDEAIDFQGGNNTTIKNCLIYANDTRYNNQDGIYCANQDLTLTVEQCVIWNFSRAGIHYQSWSTASTGTFNVNSTIVYNCGRSGESDIATAGGVAFRATDNSSSLTLNMHNCLLCENDTDNISYDICTSNGPRITTNVSHTIYGSMGGSNTPDTSPDTGSNNTSGASITDNLSPGAGDWGIVEDITTYPYDLRLVDDADNDAQDYHSTATAHSLTIPSTDIVGTSRPQNTNYDCGAFEIISGGATTITRTSSLDSLIKKTGITQTVSLDSLIQKTLSAAVSGDALIQAAIAGTISTDALIQALQTKTISLDSLIQSGALNAASLDAVLQIALSSEASLDALLTATGSAQVVVDALIQGGVLATTNVDALIQKTNTESTALDALIQAAQLGVVSVDALLQSVIATTVSLDAIIISASAITEAASLDAIIQAVISQTLSLDALIQSTETATLSLDATVQKPLTIAVTLNALIQAAQSGSVSLDAILISAGEVAISASLDALIQAIISEQLSLDALLQKGQTASAGLDAMVQIAGIETVSMGALIQGTVSGQLSVDALITASQQVTVTLDALLQIQQTGSLSLDAIIGLLGSATIDLDAVLLLTQTTGLSLDSIIGVITQSIGRISLINQTQAFGAFSKTQAFGASSKTHVFGLRKAN